MLNNQGPGTGNTLEPDVRVVEVCSSHGRGDVHFIVEEVEWRDGPLRDKRRAVCEWRHGLREAVPVLF